MRARLLESFIVRDYYEPMNEEYMTTIPAGTAGEVLRALNNGNVIVFFEEYEEVAILGTGVVKIEGDAK